MKVIRNDRANFDLEEFLSRPLFAHLATASDLGPRESPVWFLWENHSVWIIAHRELDTFPKRVAIDPRVALGIVDFDPKRGLVQHVGFRGQATVEEFDIRRAKQIFRRYLGYDEGEWDPKLTGDVIQGHDYQ